MCRAHKRKKCTASEYIHTFLNYIYMCIYTHIYVCIKKEKKTSS